MHTTVNKNFLIRDQQDRHSATIIKAHTSSILRNAYGETNPSLQSDKGCGLQDCFLQLLIILVLERLTQYFPAGNLK